MNTNDVLSQYQKTILVWLYGLQNYQGIFANVPPPEGIRPPAVSQAPNGEAWIACDTTAGEPSATWNAVPEIPGTIQNDPQVAIYAMPDLVVEEGGTLLLTLSGARVVEKEIDLSPWPALAEEMEENVSMRRAILSSAAGTQTETEIAAGNKARWFSNQALLARAGMIERDGEGRWMLAKPRVFV